MWRWLLAGTLAGCVYHPQKLTFEGDTPGDGDALATRLDTWTDLGGSSVGPRDAPLETSTSGGGISHVGSAELPSVAVTDSTVVVAWQDMSSGVATIKALRFEDDVWSSFDDEPTGYVGTGTRPQVALEAYGTPVLAYEHNGSVAVVKFDGSAWSAYGNSLQLTTSSNHICQPALAIDVTLGAVIAYRTGTAGEATTQAETVRVVRHEAINGWTNMPNAPLELPASYGGDHPDLAFTPTHEAVVVWDGDPTDDGTHDIYLRKLEGSTWVTVGGTVVISDTEASEPAVAVNPQGHIAVAWLSTGAGPATVHLKTFDPSGSWQGLQGSAVEGVSANPDGSQPPPFAPDVAFPGPENFDAPIVTYSAYVGYRVVHVRTPGRGVPGWHGPTFPFYPSDGSVSWRDHTANDPAIALRPSSGRPVVAWTNENDGNSEIYVKQYGCLTMWEPLIEGASAGVSDAPVCAETPSLKMNSEAKPAVAWQTVAAGNWEIYLRRWNGSLWSGLAGSDTGGGVSNTPVQWQDSGWPSLAIGSNGKPQVAWAEWLNAPDDHWTVYARAFESGRWAELGDSATDTGVPLTGPSQFPALAAGPSGQAWLAWLRDTGDLAVAQWNGSAWEYRESPIQDPAVGLVGRPTLGVDSTGVPVLGWFRQAGNEMAVYVHRYEGQWIGMGGSNGRVAGGTSWAANPSLAIESNDAPVIAVMEQSGAWEIVVRRWNQNAWQRLGMTDALRTNRESREPSLALDSDDQPVVAWAEATTSNFEIYLARFDGSRWLGVDGSNATGGISNTGADSRYPSLDIARDRACVAWTDAGPSGLQIAARCIDLPE